MTIGILAPIAINSVTGITMTEIRGIDHLATSLIVADAFFLRGS